MSRVIVFDADTLITMLSAKAHENNRERINFLIEDTRKSRGRILIPAPALSEFSVKAKKEEIDFLLKENFKIVPFDTRSAIECGELFKKWHNQKGVREISRTKLKFDLQILAIVKVNDVTLLVTGDKQLTAMAKREGIKTCSVHEIEYPGKQLSLLSPSH